MLKWLCRWQMVSLISPLVELQGMMGSVATSGELRRVP